MCRGGTDNKIYLRFHPICFFTYYNVRKVLSREFKDLLVELINKSVRLY